MAIDLASAVATERDKTQEYLQQLSAVRDTQYSIGERQAAQTLEMGAEANTALAQELKGKKDAQDAARAAADAWGNGTGPDNIRAMLGQDFLDNYMKARATAELIQEKQASSWLDNPLQALSDTLTVGKDIANHNGYAAKANTAASAMDELNKITNETAIAQNSIAKTLTDDSIAAKLHAQALSTSIAADEITKNNFGFQVDKLKEIQNADSKSLERQFQLNSAQNAAANLAISQQSLKLHQQQAEALAEERALKLEERQNNMDDLKHYAEVVNRGRTIMGSPAIGAKELDRAVKNGAIDKEQAKRWYVTGALDIATGQKVISQDPAVSTLAILQDRAPLIPTMEPVSKYLLDIANSARQNPQFKAKPSDAAFIAAVGNTPTDGAKLMLQDTTKSSATGVPNIYTAPDITTMASIPVISKSPFFIAAVQPLMMTGTKISDPNLLMSSGVEAVKAGKLSMNDLVFGYAEYYKAATLANNANRDYARVGLPTQSTYVATVKNGSTGMLDSTNKIDLTNPTAVANVINRRIMIERFNSGADRSQSAMNAAFGLE